MDKVFNKDTWFTRIKILIISGLFASISNWISTSVTFSRSGTGTVYMPWEVFPALTGMFFIIIFCCALDDVIRAYTPVKLPNILYISTITVFLSIPGLTPMGQFMLDEFGKIGLLPLCTPILAYAGIAIGRDLDDFKKQGLAIMVVACLTFVGTYMGSALIAHLILSAQGLI